MKLLTRVALVALAAAICFQLSGCGQGGGKLVTVTGRLVENGQPVRFEGADFEEGAAMVEVTFYPVDDAGNMIKDKQPYTTTVNTDGTFVVDGPEGKGIPTGRYKIALRYEGSGEPGGQAGGVDWASKLAPFDEVNTPFIEQIDSQREIVLDLAKAPQGGSG